MKVQRYRNIYKTVTEQKWGSIAHHHQKSNSRGRGCCERKRVFIQMLNDLGGWGTPHLQAHPLISSAEHKPNLAAPSKTKTKGSAQNSHSIVKYCPLEAEDAKVGCSLASCSLLESVSGAGATTGHAASSSKVHAPGWWSWQSHWQMLG